jgi:predicted chitinase
MKTVSAVSLCLLLALAGCAGAPTAPPVARSDAGFVPTRAQFEQLFPQRLAFYSYEGFVAAAAAFPRFANSGDATRDRREMAAFMANIAHESDQLRAVREYNQANYDHYCRTGPGERCAPGRQYYGRGPIQLSWNYQYAAAGQVLGLDLWSNPDLVATDATVAWQTAIWYWMVQTGPNTISAHQAMADGAGFGATIRSINGVIECDKPDDRDAQRKIARRIDFYQRASALFAVDPGGALRC